MDQLLSPDCLEDAVAPDIAKYQQDAEIFRRIGRTNGCGSKMWCFVVPFISLLVPFWVRAFEPQPNRYRKWAALAN